MLDSAYIKSATAISPLGSNIDQTAAAVRATISRFDESNFYDHNFSPIKMALVPENALPTIDKLIMDKEALTSRQTRLLRLSITPLIEIFKYWESNLSTPIFLAYPETLPGHIPVLNSNFIRLLSTQTNLPINVESSKIFPYGRAAGLHALQAAMEYIANNPGHKAIIGGVDSYLDPYLLSTLTRESRISSPGVMDGFIPGEGAAFLLIDNNPSSNESNNKLGFKIHNPGITEETGHRYSNHPYKGDGLTKAVSQTLCNSAEKINTVYISLNGENFYSKEWGVTLMRNSNHFEDEPTIIHPADCLGDIGAAFAPMTIGIAMSGIQNQYVKPPVLISCSSEMQHRSATYLTMS